MKAVLRFSGWSRCPTWRGTERKGVRTGLLFIFFFFIKEMFMSTLGRLVKYKGARDVGVDDILVLELELKC